MPHPLGLGHFTFLDHTPAQLIRLAAETGFNFVGLRLHPIAPGELKYDLRDGSPELNKVQSLMRDTGVGVYDIETVVVSPGFNPKTLLDVLEQSALLGAKRLNICGDDPDPNRMQDTFNAICELARPFNIGIDIECMKWRVIDTVEKCVTLVKSSNDPNAGVLIDTLHLDRCGGSAQTLTRTPPQFIKSAQLCDAPAIAPNTTKDTIIEARSGRLPPGDGGLPLHSIVSALPRNTVMSVELPMTTHLPVATRAKMIYDKTQSHLAHAIPDQHYE